MIKFIIAARRKREDTQERYFYEWGIIHVALMVTTPSVMQTFRRYVQHYSIPGIEDDRLLHPLSPMAWDNMADHWLDGLEQMVTAVRAGDNVARMQPHVFGDKEFVLQLMEGEVLHEAAGFQSGGVKLIHFLKRDPRLTRAEFNARWRGSHAPALLAATVGPARLRRYVQNRALEFERSFFRGSIFEHGEVNGYDGVEEFWFDTVDDLSKLRHDPAILGAVRDSEAGLVDAGCSFSMVTTERVIYDYTRGADSSPQPAILNPESLEAAIFRQGLSGWNLPPAAGGKHVS
jgi:hypothetical protein